MTPSCIIQAGCYDLDLSRVQSLTNVTASRYWCTMVSDVSLLLEERDLPRKEFLKAWRAAYGASGEERIWDVPGVYAVDLHRVQIVGPVRTCSRTYDLTLVSKVKLSVSESHLSRADFIKRWRTYRDSVVKKQNGTVQALVGSGGYCTPTGWITALDLASTKPGE